MNGGYYYSAQGNIDNYSDGQNAMEYSKKDILMNSKLNNSHIKDYYNKNPNGTNANASPYYDTIGQEQQHQQQQQRIPMNIIKNLKKLREEKQSNFADESVINQHHYLSGKEPYEFGRRIYPKDDMAGKIGYNISDKDGLDIFGSGIKKGQRNINAWNDVRVGGSVIVDSKSPIRVQEGAYVLNGGVNVGKRHRIPPANTVDADIFHSRGDFFIDNQLCIQSKCIGKDFLENGARGKDGPIGPIGPTGPRGIQGEKGDIGIKGPVGQVGMMGSQGPKGEMGPNGEIGPIGPKGPLGSQGNKGEKGSIGLVGPIGPRGEQGVPGTKGNTGKRGKQGEPGFPGSDGDDGPVGSMGPPGPPGNPGPQGVQGLGGLGKNKFDAIRLGDKWTLSGVGDNFDNDEWLRLIDPKIQGRSLEVYGSKAVDFGDEEMKVCGFAAGKLWSGYGIVYGSDRRMKENIHPITDDKISKDLRPVEYTLKSDETKRKRFGFIAQDIEKIYPNTVEDGANGMKSLRYSDFIPIITKNLQTLNAEQEKYF